MYHGEHHAAAGFGHAIWNVLIVGAALFLLFRHHGKKYRVRDGFLILAACWFFASLFGSLPYYYAGLVDNPVDAFFEAASGFSTTGATVFDDVEVIPNGVLLWRSMTSWLGGMGILVFAVALMPTLGINGTSVAEPDKPSVTINSFSPKTLRMVSGIIVGYAALTLLEIILLAIGGMGLFDSVIHSMGTVSTGGFSNYNDGILHFGGIYARVIILIFMLIVGTNFTMYYSFTRRGIRAFTEDSEFKAFWLIAVIAFAIVFCGLYFIDTGWTRPGEAANSAFQVVSILTTTGYVSDNFTAWPAFCQMILVLLMFIGGCSSSSSSGNKVVRFVVIFKLVFHGIQTRLHSNVIRPVKLNKKDVPNDTVSAVSNHMFLYIVMTFIGAFVMSLENIDLLDCFTSTLSLLGNVGPCFGSVGVHGYFGDFNYFTKAFMSFVMIAGRLELYTILVLFTPGFWRSE
ncbi:MAG: TrkH family potassium uptake protein [Clostridia bacterium]|nr:TrkH family potassium uptake protein [Clostridia bacterium]